MMESKNIDIITKYDVQKEQFESIYRPLYSDDDCPGNHRYSSPFDETFCPPSLVNADEFFRYRLSLNAYRRLGIFMRYIQDQNDVFPGVVMIRFSKKYYARYEFQYFKKEIQEFPQVCYLFCGLCRKNYRGKDMDTQAVYIER